VGYTGVHIVESKTSFGRIKSPPFSGSQIKARKNFTDFNKTYYELLAICCHYISEI
jgi:hypothetical protein